MRSMLMSLAVGWAAASAAEEPMAAVSLPRAAAMSVSDIRVVSGGAISETLVLSNVSIVCDSGVVIVFRTGEKKNAIEAVGNVRIEGCEFRGEWIGPVEQVIDADGPHGLSIRGGSDISVVSTRFVSFKGDGIYIGPSRTDQRLPSSRITIQRCASVANGRQGISISSARGVSVQNCLFSDTRGSPPQCGIDIEPASAADVVADITFEDCSSAANAGRAYFVNVSRLTDQSAPVSVRFLRCVASFTTNRGLLDVVGLGPEDPTPARGFVIWNGEANWGRVE